MYDKRRAVILINGVEKAFDIEYLRSDGQVSLSGFLDYVDMMDIVQFEDQQKAREGEWVKNSYFFHG